MSDDSPEVELFTKGTEIKPPTWDELDAVPKADLRELVEEWRNHDPSDRYDYQERIGLEIAADELEQVLEDE